MIELRKINMGNFNQVLKLELKEEQKKFVASNMYSLAEAKADEVSKPYAIYFESRMVGFIMYDFAPEQNKAYISRLMIDKNHQGRGYARKAMELVLTEIRQIQNCNRIQISYAPENNIARSLYESLGFVRTGEFHEGEEVAVLIIEDNKKIDKSIQNMTLLNFIHHNRDSWDHEVKMGNVWTQPVNQDQIEEAKKNKWEVVLTPTIPVPRNWFDPTGNIKGKKILCLASGGGQQGPIFAAAGAEVTVFDNSPLQLAQDETVAKRDNLKIRTILGDMRDLSCFKDEEFNLIFHPVSNCFIDNVNLVWKGCYRVLKKGGALLSGFCNPLMFIFDFKEYDDHKNIKVRYKIPYSDLEQLPKDQLEEFIRTKEPLTWGHSLEDQIGGQLKAGFILTGFYDDISNGDFFDEYISVFIATKAEKQ